MQLKFIEAKTRDASIELIDKQLERQVLEDFFDNRIEQRLQKHLKTNSEVLGDEKSKLEKVAA